MVAKIEWLRREHTWSASRIEFELAPEGVIVSRRTISLILLQLGPNRRRFIDPNGDSNREPQRIVAKRPSHTVHVDVKKVGHIPDGGGWRVHGRESLETRAVERTKKRGTRRGDIYLHSAIDGHTRVAYTEALDDMGATAAEFLDHAKAWFAALPLSSWRARLAALGGDCRRGDHGEDRC